MIALPGYERVVLTCHRSTLFINIDDVKLMPESSNLRQSSTRRYVLLHILVELSASMITYHHLTHHIVPGPQSISYIIPIILLPTALLIPRSVLSRWQNVCLFLPLSLAFTIHAWIQMGCIDVITVDVFLWTLCLLVLKDPWENFRYVAIPGSPSEQEHRMELRDGKTLQKRQDDQGVSYPTDLAGRVPWILTLISSIRLNGWKTGRPSHNIWSTQRIQISRTTFARQALICFIRGYLTLDATRAYQSFDPYFSDLAIPISSPLPFREIGFVPPRLFRALIMMAQVWAVISQFIYLPCLLLIGLNAAGRLPDEWSPHTWQPIFGNASVVLSYGIRGFWGRYWHQAMRVFASAPGEALCDSLELGSRSLARFMFITTIAFGLSGIIHMGLVPPEPLYATTSANEIRLLVAVFFWLQPLGMLIELYLVKLLSAIFGGKLGTMIRVAVHVVFFVAWFTFCLPIFGEAARQLGYWCVWLVPISLWKGLRGEGWIAWEFLR